ncbi:MULTISPECIES: ERF family protein [unclassified Streptomyces]|uniref:ERF family protein n=1 Tax=unclassified Streptomyces TaxID=2593676 RepID=UPI003333A2ED
MAADTAEEAPEKTAPPLDPWPPTRHLTVDEAMVAVMREIGAVGKNGYNKNHEYHFRAQEDIVAAVRGPMARHGLRMLPRVIEQQHFARGKSNVAILTIEYVVRGPGGDVMQPSIVVVGEGADVSDKASNKAMTAAKKYALVQAFEIASDNVDDSDRQSPDSTPSPLDPYLNRINRADVWYNVPALNDVRERAEANSHGSLTMPDGRTLVETLDAQIAELDRRAAEDAKRHGEERAERDTQMRAEHPTYHRPSPDAHLWQQPSQASGQTRQGTPQSPRRSLPDSAEIAQRLLDAMSDPQTAVRRLNEVLRHYTPEVLKKVTVETKWGDIDGAQAVRLALQEVARLKSSATTPGLPPATGQQSSGHAPQPPTPASDETPPAQPAPSPAAERSEDSASAGSPAEEASPPATDREVPPEKPAPRPAPAPAAPQQTKVRPNKSELARARLEAEAAFQAQMLRLSTNEHVADLLPAGARGIEDIPGAVRLQAYIVKSRPAVLRALIEAGMVAQAEMYDALGDRAPAPNIEAIIKSALQPQQSF